jgi:hypothetical protein
MTNPLIEKFYELHPEKKEKPKGKVAEVDEAFKKWASNTNSTSVASNLTNPSVATSTTGITKASPIKCFDNESLTDAFLQIAEKVKNGTAQVYSMNMDMDYSYRTKRITFEVWDNL